MPLVFVTLRNKITMAYLFQNSFIIIQTMNHVETHIGNNMKSCAIRAQLITILLVTLRLCRRRRSPAKVTGLENRATFPPIRNSTDSNEL